MADAPQHVWVGHSGRRYSYGIYPIGTSFVSVPANYIYAISSGSGWQAVYIGETEDLSQRTLDTHHKQDCIRANGATHIHAHKSSEDADVRRAEEADLVDKHRPPCND